MDSKSKIARFHETLNSLNENQRESVLSNGNNLQIMAGPGSGKTKVLACRVAYFVIERGISPKNIIVVTFTNKAANEMKMRLKSLIGEEETNSLVIGTFHSICCRILRTHANLVDLGPNFAVADNETSKDIISIIRDDKQLKISKFTRETMKAGAIWGIISKAKNRGETCLTYSRLYGSEFKTKDIAILYTRYEAELKRLNMVYQDTNIVQYDLVKLIMSQNTNKEVTIVGDPDQSIYGFRSAEPKNFKKMRNDFSSIEIINLEQNYRSTGKILKAAMHVICNSSSRFNKSLHTNNPEGKPIYRITTVDEETQAEFLATEIQKIISGSMGLINYKDIAVLMRMNFISRQFEAAFRHYKIPFTIVGGDRFFDRVEVKDILSYLNFAYNPKDSFSFSRIVNVPKRGIGDVNLKKILDKNEMDKVDLMETIMEIGRSNSRSFGVAIKKKLLEFGAICSTLKQMMTEQAKLPEIIQYLLDAIKYNDYLKEHYFSDHEARWNNIGELISVARKSLNADSEASKHAYDESNDQLQTIDSTKNDDSLEIDEIAKFLEYCKLCSNQKELEEAEGGKVVLATLHSAKGLEWPCVFIATCNDGVIPHSKSLLPKEIEEECRLLYVGITRSKFLMYCVTPEERNSWCGRMAQTKSPFLEGMSMEMCSTSPPIWDDEMRSMLAQTIGKQIHVATTSLKRTHDEDGAEPPNKLKCITLN